MDSLRHFGEYRPHPDSIQAFLDKLPRGGAPDEQVLEGMDGDDYDLWHVVVSPDPEVLAAALEAPEITFSSAGASAAEEATAPGNGAERLDGSPLPAVLGALASGHAETEAVPIGPGVIAGVPTPAEPGLVNQPA